MAKNRTQKRTIRVGHHRKRAIPAAKTEETTGRMLGSTVVQLAKKSPNCLAPADILALQQTVGNQAVQRLINQGQNSNGSNGKKDPTGQPGSQGTHSQDTTPRLNTDRQGFVQRDIPTGKAGIKDRQAYERAKAAHDKDRKTMHSILTDARKQTADIRLRNSAEWVMQGVTGRTLWVLTPTHDASTRLEHIVPGQSAGLHTYFPYPKGAMYKKGKLRPAVYYDRDNDSVKNLKFFPPKVEAMEEAGEGFFVIGPGSRSRTEVEGTLRHEVQHAADLSGKAGGSSPNKMDQALNIYQSEYRAHSFESKEFDGYSTKKKVTKVGFTWTERQWAIFSDIHNRYDLISGAWKDSSDLDAQQNFQKAVVAFKMPKSVNPQNSTRVEALNQFLAKRKPAEFKPVTPLPKSKRSVRRTYAKSVKNAKKLYKKLLKLVGKLDPEDRRSLVINPGAKALRLKVLGAVISKKIETEIEKGMRKGRKLVSELFS